MTSSLKLDLLKNAHSFLDESLRNATLAEEDVRQWKFALINIAQAIELFVKERLRRVHSLFVYAIIDKPRHTVSLETALARLKQCKVHLDEEDLVRVKRAKDIRNDLVHFGANLTSQQLENSYVDLFEFAHVFHEKELDGELHDFISNDHWGTEAALMEKFRREHVSYQGERIVKSFPSEIVRSQFFPNYTFGGNVYDRIPYGQDWPEDVEEPARPNCRDCGVVAGQFHAVRCRMEQCPRCHGPLVSCSCASTRHDADRDS